MECTVYSVAIEKEVLKVKNKKVMLVQEPVVIERVLTVYLNRKEYITLVCSPDEERELVLGFFFSERIINSLDQVLQCFLDKENGVAYVEISEGNGQANSLLESRYLDSSGAKERSTFCNHNGSYKYLKTRSSLTITSVDVINYMSLLEEQSNLFNETGGVHNGALASEGKFDFFTIDIGRHNVMDKLFGRAMLEEMDLTEKVIIFSGRISSEILLKTAKMGCPILVGISAPTELALNLANELGITVIGFARDSRMNIYTHPERVIFPGTL